MYHLEELKSKISLWAGMCLWREKVQGPLFTGLALVNLSPLSLGIIIIFFWNKIYTLIDKKEKEILRAKF